MNPTHTIAYVASSAIFGFTIFPKIKQIYASFTRKEHNPTHLAYLDFDINGQSMGRVDLELFGNQAPKTVNNFLALCTGDHSKQLNYKGSIVHRRIPGYLIQAGDVLKGDGTGGISVYSENDDQLFENEINSQLKFDEPYLLAMANKGTNKNGSQFFITLDKLPYLNGNYTIFGRVKRNTHMVDLISACSDDSKIMISNSGVYIFEKKGKHTLSDPTISVQSKYPQS